MHIPDGFLAPKVWLSAWIVSMGALSYCLRKTSAVLKDRMIPLMGVTAAFIFAAQMINFPVLGGTSGHLLGGVLSAVLLGPFAGAIVISVVLIVQCLIFQDGGLTALGANMLNMAFIGSMASFFVYNFLRKIIKNKKSIIIVTGITSWLSVIGASAACAIELGLSGTVSLQVVLPVMVFVHMVIGIGEAIVTCLIIGFILKVRPDLIHS